MNVGVVGNPRYADLGAVLAHVAREAPARGITLFTEARLDPFWPCPLPHIDEAPTEPPLHALLTFGGDGTLLRGARMLRTRSTCVLGVNLGRVGFLTTATLATLDQALAALVSGDYIIEPRQGLTAQILARDGEVRAAQPALNDVAIHKGGVARVIRVNVFIEGENVGPYSGDGIVVATPTGSTAYSLSAGGPIVVPGVKAMLVTPICAHTLAVRPLVVPASYTIVVEPIDGWGDDLLVSFDGQTGSTLAGGESVRVSRADEPIHLVRLSHDGFFARMRQKLHWGDLSEREVQR
ncbi:MAG TPA: NAD(+)/NADH kinase [Gemmatimonadales bacterium]|nr:NAD(+)/NADH kinase [Gemmatimonadales bacterium]